MKSAARVIGTAIAVPLIAGAVSAQTALRAWLTLPAWQQAVEAVKAGEGESAVAHEPQAGRQLSGFDFLLSAAAQIDALPISREFYFDAERKLALVRIVPAKTDLANCNALLVATMKILGKEDGQPTINAIPLTLMDRRYWFRSKDDRLYSWSQIKPLRDLNANTPCGLSIEPYKAGMARNKKG